MQTFTLLWGKILDSSVWMLSKEARLVWITILAMKDKNGLIQASIPGLAHRARVTLEECESALVELLAPDQYSGTPDEEGRRIVGIQGGWRVVNHELYRMSEEARREEARMRKAKERAGKKALHGKALGPSKVMGDDMNEGQYVSGVGDGTIDVQTHDRVDGA